MLRKILILLLSLTLLLFCCGCNQQQNETPNITEPSESVEGTTNVPTTEPTINDEDANIGIVDHTAVEVKTQESLLKKPYEEFSIMDFCIDSQWQDRIIIDGIEIKSTTCYDISTINNYFFDTEYHAPLDILYSTKAYKFPIETKQIDCGNFTSINLRVITTTLLKESQSYGIIEEIILNSTINTFEVDTSKFQTREGFISIGSSLTDIENTLGKASVQSTMSNGIGGATIVLCYESQNARLSFNLIAQDESDLNSAIVTWIKWEPLAVQQILHTQDHLNKK